MHLEVFLAPMVVGAMRLLPHYSWHGHFWRMAASATNRKSCAPASGFASMKLSITCSICSGVAALGWQNLRLSGSTRLTNESVAMIPAQRPPAVFCASGLSPAMQCGSIALALLRSALRESWATAADAINGSSSAAEATRSVTRRVTRRMGRPPLWLLQELWHLPEGQSSLFEVVISP